MGQPLKPVYREILQSGDEGPLDILLSVNALRHRLWFDMSGCSCGAGEDTSRSSSEYNDFGRYATRIPLPNISAIPFIATVCLISALTSSEIVESSMQNGVDDAEKV